MEQTQAARLLIITLILVVALAVLFAALQGGLPF